MGTPARGSNDPKRGRIRTARGQVVPVEPGPAAPSDATRSALWGQGVAFLRGSPASNVAGARQD